ncbi:MAG: tyrosinase family protein [Gammaproteobacteria bacterium]
MAEFIYRLNIRNFSPGQLKKLRQAYTEMMQRTDNYGFAHLAGFHGFPSWQCWHHQTLGQERGPRRGIRLFLPWHRAYLHQFELALRDRSEEVALPWWDWRSEASFNEGFPQAFSEPLDADNQANPLYGFHMRLDIPGRPLDRLTRRFGRPLNQLPYPDIPSGFNDTLEWLLSIESWREFSDRLQDVHDHMHGWIGGYKRDANDVPLQENDQPATNVEQVIWGDMGDATIAAYDPIFFSHHAMVDRIWWLWQQRWGIENIDPQLLDSILAPFNLTVREVLQPNSLGYEYAYSAQDIEQE